MSGLFYCGWYQVKWYDNADNIVKDEKMYLTSPLYRREVLNMQTAYLRGENVVRMVATPIE